MRIEEAVEILTIQITGGPTPHPQDYIDALKLGIEALQRLQQYRQFHRSTADVLLPGETEE